MHVAWYKVVENIMKMAVDVQQHKKPMLTKIAVMDLSKEKIIGDFDVVSIWAGVGESNPIERIKHLRAQNNAMKEVLKLCKGDLQIGGNNDLILNINIILDTFE